SGNHQQGAASWRHPPAGLALQVQDHYPPEDQPADPAHAEDHQECWGSERCLAADENKIQRCRPEKRAHQYPCRIKHKTCGQGADTRNRREVACQDSVIQNNLKRLPPAWDYRSRPRFMTLILTPPGSHASLSLLPSQTCFCRCVTRTVSCLSPWETRQTCLRLMNCKGHSVLL